MQKRDLSHEAVIDRAENGLVRNPLRHHISLSLVGKAAADGIGYEIARDFGTIVPVTPYCKV
ncbi:hypothetical protein [Mesorhizobium sp. M1406]|uniref:hypothetical protein n=1 Tax=Mesorhizobium sp. M1406 TaxID=2957099 RepID=UPI00333B4642